MQMADWSTIDLDGVIAAYDNDSRKSSKSSGHSDNKENKLHSPAANSNRNDIVLNGGNELSDESRTEMSPIHSKNSMYFTDVPPREPVTKGPSNGNAKSPKSSNISPPTDPVTTENITIPVDANISSFTCDQMGSFFKCLKIEDRIISHLQKKSVDGRRFAKMKDTELESLGMNTPVVIFFRNKSGSSKTKGKGPFML